MFKLISRLRTHISFHPLLLQYEVDMTIVPDVFFIILIGCHLIWSFQNQNLMYAAQQCGYSPPVNRTQTLLAATDQDLHNHRLPAKTVVDSKSKYVVQQMSHNQIH